MFWALRPQDAKRNLLLSWLFSTLALALIFRWVVGTIALYSNIPGPISFALLLVGAGLIFGWIYIPAWMSVMPLRRWFGAWWVALFPCVLVATEFVVSWVMIFPWQMGVAHYRVPEVFQLASVTGVWGVSWLVAFVNAGLAEVMYSRQEGKPFPAYAVAVPIAALSLNVIWGANRYAQVEATLREAPVARVAQLQSPHDMVYRMSRHSSASWAEWLARTEQLKPGAVDIVVWPEGACPYDLQQGRAHDKLSSVARAGGWEMVVGAGARVQSEEGRDDQFNSVYFIDSDGTIADRYDKMVPLLFGERLPGWLYWLHDYVQGIGDFRAGTEATVYAGSHARIASPICYEAIFGNLCRQYEGAELFVNVTNDAWFGDTACPHQHGMLAAIRSTELGIPMFRSAYSGISMVVEPHGHIHAETQPFTEVARIVEVRLAQFDTLYRAWGDWFAWLCLLVSGVVLPPLVRLRHPHRGP